MAMSSVHTPEYQEFLGKLKAARNEAGLTQANVAERMGRPQSFIAKCESGERRVDAVELATLAKIYVKELDYFI